MDLQWIAIQGARAATSSPSASRSSHKRQISTVKASDPLLSHISSTAALEALEASSTANPSSQDGLYHSIAAASPSEKSLAIRAASAGKRLEEWRTEIQQWQWPSSYNAFEAVDQKTASFEPGPDQENGLSGRALGDDEDVPAITPEHCGSLPAQTVLDYQKRIDEVREAMDALELHELKARVRDAHFASTTSNLSGYSHLDDFAAVITTIIMRALPVVFRLEALLGVWEARLAVLRAVPGFTNTMSQAQEEMTAAWNALDHFNDKRNSGPKTRPFILGLRARLESQIRDLGQRLDFMLDTLEGRQDTLPDSWIDDMEQLEADFGSWVVEVDRLTVGWELTTGDDLRGWHEDSLGESTDPRIRTSRAVENEAQTDVLGDGLSTVPADGSMDTQGFDGSASMPNIGPEGDDLPFSESVPHGSENGLFPISHRHLPLNLEHRQNDSAPSDFSSESSCPGSATSEYFPNTPTPEIRDASKTEYFGVGTPVEVTTPTFPRSESKGSDQAVSRPSGQRTEREGRPSPAITSPTRSRASTVVPAHTIDEDENQVVVAGRARRQSSLSMAVDVASQSARVNATTNGSGPRPPIPSKSRHRFEDFTDLSPGNTPVKVIRRRTADFAHTPASPQALADRTATVSPTKSTDDELEARINSILTDIPADIRLARGSNAQSNVIGQRPASRNAKFIKRPTTPRLMRSQTAIPSTPPKTLTPAAQKTGRSSNGEPEIYHLHQPGKEAPIKLLVRLVGEGGERVMVRIGGGWADLAEYLKEYATHHGRRTMSDGRFDIQGLPRSQPSSPVTTPGTATLPSSPGALSDYSNDRPTSRDSNASSRRSWMGDDSPSLGLAGPKSRNATISPNKQAWVDTMVEKARGGSGEKNKGARNAFGDLGIIGGTKRLFMKKDRET
ncbi:MAG: hypothetical protein Q9211_002995 [Gyalolechia sp. 1 TL-2023]